MEIAECDFAIGSKRKSGLEATSGSKRGMTLRSANVVMCVLTIVPWLSCCSINQPAPDYRVGDAFFRDARGLPFYAPVKISLNRLEYQPVAKPPIQRGIVFYVYGHYPVVIDLDRLEVRLIDTTMSSGSTATSQTRTHIALSKLEAAEIIDQANALWGNSVICHKNPAPSPHGSYGPTAVLIDHEYLLEIFLDCLSVEPEIESLRRTFFKVQRMLR